MTRSNPNEDVPNHDETFTSIAYQSTLKLLECKRSEDKLRHIILNTIDYIDSAPSIESSIILDFLLRNGCSGSAAAFSHILISDVTEAICFFWRHLYEIARTDIEGKHTLAKLLLRLEEFKGIESKLEALEYAQSYFPALISSSESTILESAMKKAMASLVQSNRENSSKEKWELISHLFKSAICQSYGYQSVTPLLRIYFEAGLSALKTPSCTLTMQTGSLYDTRPQNSAPPLPKDKCPICSDEDFFTLSEPLPCSKKESSQILCRITGDIISSDGSHKAVCLPNGQVFSERALVESNGFTTCPVTGEKFSTESIQKVFFL